MAETHINLKRKSERGFSAPEMLIVVVIIAILAAIALPQLIAARRMYQFNGVTREIIGQLRNARQQAMSQRQVVRFRYDDTNKMVYVVDNNQRPTPGNPIFNDPANDEVMRTVNLANGGTAPANIICGSPGGAPTVPNSLPDTATRTNTSGLGPLVAGGPGVQGIEVIFQPDGSVVDAAGNPINIAIYLYNQDKPRDTLRVISVLGTGGRVKLWRYNQNGNNFIEQ